MHDPSKQGQHCLEAIDNINFKNSSLPERPTNRPTTNLAYSQFWTNWRKCVLRTTHDLPVEMLPPYWPPHEIEFCFAARTAMSFMERLTNKANHHIRISKQKL